MDSPNTEQPDVREMVRKSYPALVARFRHLIKQTIEAADEIEAYERQQAAEGVAPYGVENRKGEKMIGAQEPGTRNGPTAEQIEQDRKRLAAQRAKDGQVQ